MNTKDLVKDTVKRSLNKYHEAFTKSIKRQLADLEARVEIVEDSALNIEELGTEDLNNIVR